MQATISQTKGRAIMISVVLIDDHPLSFAILNTNNRKNEEMRKNE